MSRRILTMILALVLSVGVVGCNHRAREGGQPPGAAPAPSATGSEPAPSPPSPGGTAPQPSRTTTPPTGTAPAPVPPPTVPKHLRGRDIEAIPTAQPVVALTFDAGANADGLPSILNTLAAGGIRGTFFVTGAFADRYPGSVRAIVAAGHRVANHSYTHPYFTARTDSQIRDELARAEAAIRARGGDPRPLFRFPYGDRNSRTIAAVNAAGYACVRWTVDTLGWQGTSGGSSVARVVDRVTSTARPGQIVLMHIGSHPTDRSTVDADALPTVIARLRAKGYRFVTLDALLNT